MNQPTGGGPPRRSPYTCPPCRLAIQFPRYTDEHQRCRGTTDIRRPGAPDHEGPIEHLRCDCSNCGHRPAPRLVAEACR